ncbi:MAG: glycosyl transferase, group 1 [Bryobacterales bacterium]|nr:glycosyl transferase, group 1 [Bryobacterales bacterium]
MPLTVLQVGFTLAPIGPDAVGGAEQVLTMLDAGLRRAGVRSLALGGERPVESITPRLRSRLLSRHRRAMESILRQERVDIVHMHGLDCRDYLPEADIPTLVTLHLPLEWYPEDLFQTKRSNLYFTCVSESQARRATRIPQALPVVANGVDADLFCSRPKKRDFALALGRICPEKGFHHALSAAQTADVPLLLAGDVFPYPAHREYFHREIVPRLDSRRRFIGPVGSLRKRSLLSRACCVLIPSLAPETSSLVAMEALACGTPVIAFASGALPEIIEDRKTGFLVSSEQEMARALRKVSELDPEDCRQAARDRFSADAMVRGYLALYERMLARSFAFQEVRDSFVTR